MRSLSAFSVWLSAVLGFGLLVLWPVSYRWGFVLGIPPNRYAMLGANNGELSYWWSRVGESAVWEVFDARTEPMTAAWIKDELGTYPASSPVWYGVASFNYGRVTTYRWPAGYAEVEQFGCEVSM